MPFLIPIIALLIPIVAILSKTYTKVHTYSDVNPEIKNRINALEERILELQKDNLQLEKAVRELEDKQNFLTRLLEDKS